MLGVVIAAALTPNLGVVSAQTGSQYGQPSSTAPITFYDWIAIGATVAVIVGLFVAILVQRRRPPA